VQNNTDTDRNVTVTASFPITGNLTVNPGPGGTAATVRITSNAGGPYTLTRGEELTGVLFSVPSNVSLTLDNIILDGGNAVPLPALPALSAQLYDESMNSGVELHGSGGPLVANFGTLTINPGAVLRNNVNLDPKSTITINPQTIDALRQQGLPRADDALPPEVGGAVFSIGTFVMNGGALRNNLAVAGGGMLSTGTADIKDGLITENLGLFLGGGIVEVLLEGSLAAQGGQPAPAADDPAETHLAISGGEISNNYAGAYGGGVAVGGLPFLLSGGTIAGNYAALGGGVEAASAAVTMTGGKISGNTARNAGDETGIGGGVHVDGATFAMTGGEISYNTAAADGGGIYAASPDDLSIAPHAVFSCNSASRAFAPGNLAPKNIAADEWTSPFTQGLNGFDVYVKGMLPPSEPEGKVIVLPAPVPPMPVPVYTVTYGGNGGKPEETQRKVAEGGVPCPPDDPTLAGFAFTGWYTDPSCTIPYTGSPIEADTPLYAGWDIPKLIEVPDEPTPWLPPCQCKGRRG
jgi:hypothetical protein